MIALLLSASSLLAQERGKVEEIKDPEIDALIARRAELYTQPREEKGYRVEIYSGPEREAYIEMRNKYRSLYPQIETHLQYVEPDFKLQVGDCRTLAEANRLRDQLLTDFEDAAVVEATITVYPE